MEHPVSHPNALPLLMPPAAAGSIEDRRRQRACMARELQTTKQALDRHDELYPEAIPATLN